MNVSRGGVMIFTLTDARGVDHQIAPVLDADGARRVYYDGDSFGVPEARRLAQALLDAAAAIDPNPAD